MNKADIINEISRETGMEKSAVVLIVEKFMANVKEALADGENIYLRGCQDPQRAHSPQYIAQNGRDNTGAPSSRFPSVASADGGYKCKFQTNR